MHVLIFCPYLFFDASFEILMPLLTTNLFLQLTHLFSVIFIICFLFCSLLKYTLHKIATMINWSCYSKEKHTQLSVVVANSIQAVFFHSNQVLWHFVTTIIGILYKLWLSCVHQGLYTNDSLVYAKVYTNNSPKHPEYDNKKNDHRSTDHDDCVKPW